MLTRKLFIGIYLVIGMSNVHGQKMEITGKYIIPDAPSWVTDAVFYQIYPQTYYENEVDLCAYDSDLYVYVSPPHPYYLSYTFR